MSGSDAAVIEVGEVSFEQDVILASSRAPVLVDFWAEWCEPCKTLSPLLERLARDSGGSFRLAKVDIEREPRLAALFQVQGVPMVVAFKAGRPVDAFAGALGEDQILDFLSRNGIEAGGQVDEPEASALHEARSLLRRHQILQDEQIRKLLESVDEDDADHSEARRLIDAMPWFEDRISGQEEAATLARDALSEWREGREEAAMETLLASIRANPGFQGELGRKALIALMGLYEERPDFVEGMRRRLALLLY